MFGEIREKKAELSRLEANIADMEAQRLRKDREFARLQVLVDQCNCAPFPVSSSTLSQHSCVGVVVFVPRCAASIALMATTLRR